MWHDYHSRSGAWTKFLGWIVVKYYYCFNYSTHNSFNPNVTSLDNFTV